MLKFRMLAFLALNTTLWMAFLQSSLGDVDCYLYADQTQVVQRENLQVRISLPQQLIQPGESLQIRAEISNLGDKDFLICKDFLSGPCNLSFTFEPLVTGEGVGVARDCLPYEFTSYPSPPPGEFAATLVRDWVSIAPGHFYGGTITISPSLHPELRVVGRYRIHARFGSGGLLNQNCYYALRPFPNEISRLSIKAWEGSVDSNAVWIRVVGERN